MMETRQRRFITVADVFEVAGRCICPAPLVPHALINPEGGKRLNVGDQLELRRPNGTVMRVNLYGLGWLSPGKGGLCIQLGPTLSKADIPVGTEIWTVGEAD